MAKEIQISSDDLSREGYSNLATKTPDNKLNASRIDTEASRAELEKLKKALAEKTSSIQGVTEADLTALLEETQDQEDPASTEEDPNPKQVSEKSNVPANIKSLANVARAQVKATFGNVADKDYASHMSNMRALLIKMIP